MPTIVPQRLARQSYNGTVARGWESKSVESQMESAQETNVRAEMRLTNEQIALQTKIDALLLQRTRVLNELERCTTDRHRITVKGGLEYLEAQLKELGWKP